LLKKKEAGGGGKRNEKPKMVFRKTTKPHHRICQKPCPGLGLVFKGRANKNYRTGESSIKKKKNGPTEPKVIKRGNGKIQGNRNQKTKGPTAHPSPSDMRKTTRKKKTRKKKKKRKRKNDHWTQRNKIDNSFKYRRGEKAQKGKPWEPGKTLEKSRGKNQTC